MVTIKIHLVVMWLNKASFNDLTCYNPWVCSRASKTPNAAGCSSLRTVKGKGKGFHHTNRYLVQVYSMTFARNMSQVERWMDFFW